MSEYKVGRCENHDEDIPLVSKSYAEANGLNYGCPGCRSDLENANDPATMSGEQREAEVQRLLCSPNLAGFDVIWNRVSALVGRETWTHELADADRLAAEARSWKHPSDLNAHALHTLEQLMGEKPVVVVKSGREAPDA